MLLETEFKTYNSHDTLMENENIENINARKSSIDTSHTDKSDSQISDAEVKVRSLPISSPFDAFCSKHAKTNNGEFLSKIEKKFKYVFNCALGHKFLLTKKQILSSVWCFNCKKLHSNLRAFAATNNGQLLSQSMLKTMYFKCDKNHTWAISYKKAMQRWCKFCSKQAKKMLKNLIQIENAKAEDQKRIHQVRLLELSS